MPNRCDWCGVFVRKDATPIAGFNINLELKVKTLCPTCGAQWIDLSMRNQLRHQSGADKVWSGYQSD